LQIPPLKGRNDMPTQWQTDISYRGPDERYLPRWEAANRVIYNLENSDEMKEGFTKDLSASGVCLRSDKEFTEFQKVILTIYFQSGDVINAQGNVVWSKQLGDQTFVGISFFNMNERTQDVILDNAFELDRKKITENFFKGW